MEHGHHIGGGGQLGGTLAFISYIIQSAIVDQVPHIITSVFCAVLGAIAANIVNNVLR